MKPVSCLLLRIINHATKQLRSLADGIGGSLHDCNNTHAPAERLSFDEMAAKLSQTIDELQQSNHALQESERNYRELVEKAHTII